MAHRQPWSSSALLKRNNYGRGLMIVIATEFITLSPLSVVSTMVLWESSQWLVKNIVRSKEFQESMDTCRCTDRHDITEILLNTTLNTIQSINQPMKTQRKEAFENILRKGENADNHHFLLFPNCFLPFPKQTSNF